MPRSLYLCVPNFSEGRRPETVAALISAAASILGVTVLDSSMDPDHNRSVVTLLGEPDPLYDAIIAMVGSAVAHIDLRTHTGVHPRVGAVDVVPIVPVQGATPEGADLLAHRIGRDVGERFGIPVYYYEWSALGRSHVLPYLRRMLKLNIGSVHLTGSLAPDEGPSEPHPSAGVTIVGARGPLVAYNIDLESADLCIAKAIAREIRSERDVNPALTGVRALGLYLETRRRAQVSMNLTQPGVTPLPGVWDFVCARARATGTAAGTSEVIGVIPAASLGGASPSYIRWKEYSPRRILDTWLDST